MRAGQRTDQVEHLIQGIRAKVIRAHAHGVDLAETLLRFTVGASAVLDVQVQSDPPGYVIRGRQGARPPIHAAVVAGEIIYHLRSALDHLAHALVLQNDGQPRVGPGGTRFPIYDAEPIGGIRVAGGVSPAALELIESLQPYLWGNARHELAAIHALSNVDKHRALYLLSVIDRAHLEGARMSTGEPIPAEVPEWVTIDDGAEIAFVSSKAPEKGARVELAGMQLSWVALGEAACDSERGPVSVFMEGLARHIHSDVLPLFNECFGDPQPFPVVDETRWAAYLAQRTAMGMNQPEGLAAQAMPSSRS